MDRAIFVDADFSDAILVRTVLTLSDLNGANGAHRDAACGRGAHAACERLSSVPRLGSEWR